MAGKKKISKGIDPEYLKKQKASLVRRHRQVIYLNDKEMEAINQYCEKFRVGTKTVLFREAIMEKVLKELDRGVTALDAMGMYSHTEKKVLLCVVNRFESMRLRRIVFEVDPRAFVIANKAKEVLGEGFKSM